MPSLLQVLQETYISLAQGPTTCFAVPELALVVLDESLEVLLEVLVVVALHIQAKNLVVLGVHIWSILTMLPLHTPAYPCGGGAGKSGGGIPCFVSFWTVLAFLSCGCSSSFLGYLASEEEGGLGTLSWRVALCLA
jgi:hypothetical protein